MRLMNVLIGRCPDCATLFRTNQMRHECQCGAVLSLLCVYVVRPGKKSGICRRKIVQFTESAQRWCKGVCELHAAGLESLGAVERKNSRQATTKSDNVRLDRARGEKRRVIHKGEFGGQHV